MLGRGAKAFLVHPARLRGETQPGRDLPVQRRKQLLRPHRALALDPVISQDPDRQARYLLYATVAFGGTFWKRTLGTLSGKKMLLAQSAGFRRRLVPNVLSVIVELPWERVL